MQTMIKQPEAVMQDSHQSGERFAQASAAEVAASLADRARICPVLAGVGWLSGGRLRLRLAGGDLEVVAPHRLLKRVLDVCDGQTTFDELVRQTTPEKRDEFASFLEFLFAQGALIDSIHLTQKAAGFGFQSSPIGESASEELTERLRKRATGADRFGSTHTCSVRETALDNCFSQRTSAYTFDDAAVSAEMLHAWLWSAAGIVSAVHPQIGEGQQHRTTGSAGGMYLVRFFVALVRQVGAYSPGVYVVEYPSERTVRLSLVSSDVALFYRCFFKPWQLTFACGAVFAVADVETAALRYRNRALQYVLLEAGASLQNLALTGPGLGLGTATVGGYCEDHVSQLCQLEREMVLGSAIFGAQATVEQQRAVAHSQPIDFVWGNSLKDETQLPFHVARARVRGKTDRLFNTFGKDRDPRLAYIKAHAETIERQAAREPKGVRLGRIDDVSDAVSPESLVAYADHQYAQRGFPFQRFQRDVVQRWVSGTDLLSGESVSVLADMVYLRKYLDTHFAVPADQYTEMNSSGCAAGPSREFALEAALLELIERDAFMRHWLTQTAGRRVDPKLLSRAVNLRVQGMTSLGCDVWVQRMDSVAANAVLVSATHAQKHFTCVAAAARFDLNEAVDSALDELQTSVYTRLTGMNYAPQRPEEVSDPEGHTMLYAQRRFFERARDVLQPSRTLDGYPQAQASDLESLLDVLAAQQLRPCFVDVTPQRNCLDQGRQPLSVIRAFIPTLIPISFGYAKEPRAMVDHVHPRSFFPHPFP
ncbi:YcaO-like family protein [Variovorax arabinosiphilus]|uniref:YcaO-like family protein n=1 Tax=Variovorax arabinosiphilus TaxID=3053498 RepID=UPI002575B0C7|nr:MULTISPECIES: YcaO-like family protein [unclassified Variovorax]MDM0122211.1 YcaO-like family protein [Variovorax sp. J2L1-78]MDM0131260.1 YcaO-like family protein [Variovorax sp. J2L1-63]MDM0234974.1 YcaO-like family protein [Variovorax sp. J2R1-6]